MIEFSWGLTQALLRPDNGIYDYSAKHVALYRNIGEKVQLVLLDKMRILTS